MMGYWYKGKNILIYIKQKDCLSLKDSLFYQRFAILETV